jgi:hypothetical protein
MVSNDDWAKMMKRIHEDDVPEAAMKSGGLWGKFLVSDNEWKILSKRTREDGIPEGFSSAILSGKSYANFLKDLAAVTDLLFWR